MLSTPTKRQEWNGFSQCQIIRLAAHRGFDGRAIRSLCNKIGLHPADGTISIQSGRGRKGEGLPDLSVDQAVQLFGQTPDECSSVSLPKEPVTERQLENQIVGNIGLFYVCYRLSQIGWNCMPTARNARGIDILIYSQDNLTKLSIQVKTLSKLKPVGLGKHLNHLFADFVIVCSKAASGSPECYVLLPSEVRELAHKGIKENRISYWLQPKRYAVQAFREAWDRIGGGVR